MRILGLVPARGGSKGVPGKNIVDLHGKPLLVYTAEAALGAKRLAKIILSTDSEEIAAVGRGVGLEVPFLRPAELARDDTPTLPVLQHALEFLSARGEHYDALCLLQPTSPLRSSRQIDAACQLFIDTEADTLLSVLAIPHQYHPDWALVPRPDESGLLRWACGADSPVPRRQDLSPAYHREGSLYISRTALIMERGTLYGERIVPFPVDESMSVNIDSLSDLERARRIIESGGLEPDL